MIQEGVSKDSAGWVRRNRGGDVLGANKAVVVNKEGERLHCSGIGLGTKEDYRFIDESVHPSSRYSGTSQNQFLPQKSS
jgi:hypothetical protein